MDYFSFTFGYRTKDIAMKNILIPTDFSINAQKAIDYALFLFEREACNFYILNAYLIVPSAPGNKLDAEHKLAQIVQKLETHKENPKHIFEWILIMDSPLNAINVTIIDKNVDYVFMGTKGSSGLREIFIGSTAMSVIKHIDHCPIFAVPAEYEYDLPEQIVFINDFRKPLKENELVPLVTIAKLWDSTLNIVHIKVEKELVDAEKLNKESLRNSLKGVKHHFIEVKMEYMLSSTIHRLENENKNIGMVAMLKNKHGFFKKLFREPVIRNVAFKTKVPLLVLPGME